MRLVYDLDAADAPWRGGALAIGNFDGVHQGHAQIVARLCAQAARVGGPAVVLTFDPHPVRLLRPHEAPPPLTWIDRKAELLAELGAQVVVAYRTDAALLGLSARAFFDDFVVRRLAARALVEGPNFYFGRQREGDVETLRRFATEAGLTLDVVPPLAVGGELVSSSRIRRLIAGGQVDAARGLLTQPYRIRGMVTHGASRGASLGFPTANLAAVDTLAPGTGVYAGRARTADGLHAAAVHIGPNPTFGEHALKIEVHLLDFAGSLYGQPLEVDFLARIRDVHPFANLEQLRAQLARDVAAARQVAQTPQ